MSDVNPENDPRPDEMLVTMTIGQLRAIVRGEVEEVVRAALAQVGAPSPIMTTAEAAQMLSLCTKTVLRLVDAGELPATRIGTQWRFMRADVEAFVASRVRKAG